MWPLAGWWSFDERVTPIACVVPSACLGIDPVAASTSTTGVTDYFEGNHRCSAGYVGVRCGDCAAGYAQLNGVCSFCGSSTNQSAALAVIVIAGCAFMALLSLFVALLSSRRLAMAVMAFVLLQEIALVATSAAKNLPLYAAQVSQVFTILNLVSKMKQGRTRKLERPSPQP
jgi:hydroxyethylthiazole kinase-like sugar kinase family protein